MLNQLKKHINNNFTFLNKSKILVAISGGIDSVVLAHLCKGLDLNFALAHCNFNLRGNESDTDETFVLKLAEELQVEAFIQNFQTEIYAKENNLSIQMAARELRYDWFNDLADQLQFDYVLTAHHANDNLETFLINFTRGTGLSGLTGIPEINGNTVRPLLPFSRETIKNYAQKQKISWREDSSNQSKKYVRNKLRQDVIPILKELNPQLLKSFKNTIENLNDTADIVDESLNAVSKRAITEITESGIIFKISEFKKVNNPKAYLFEMFRDYGFSEWNDVVNLLEAETGKFVVSKTHKLTKHREHLILSDYFENNCHIERSPNANARSFEIENQQENIKTPIGNFFFREVNEISNTSKNTIFVDKQKLNFPLELRLWNTKDIFYPLGMKGKKKISKYLKDEKLKPNQKQNTWVLTSGNKIIWVVGMRADERFKVSNKTKNILQITIHNLHILA